MRTIVLGAADCSHRDIHISDGLTSSMTSPDFSAIPLIYTVLMVKLRPFSSRVIAFGTRPAIQQPRWPSSCADLRIDVGQSGILSVEVDGEPVRLASIVVSVAPVNLSAEESDD